MIQGLADFSNAVAGLVAGNATLVAAIRIGPNRHISGLHWSTDTIVTADQSLPAQDSYSLILGSGAVVAARPGPRDPSLNLAVLRLETPLAAPDTPTGADLPVGGMVLLLGASFDGSPTARLGLVHARTRGNGASALLDLRATAAEAGGAVLDMNGRLLGVAAPTASDQLALVSCADVAGLSQPGGAMPHQTAAQGTAQGTTPQPTPMPHTNGARVTNGVTNGAANGTRRGWLGVALQPITVPEPLVPRAGQTSGRMVVNITNGGPADLAGLRVGDVLLALNGHSASGSHALRAFLGADRIGTQIEVRLLRDGAVLSTLLTVAAQPH